MATKIFIPQFRHMDIFVLITILFTLQCPAYGLGSYEYIEDNHLNDESTSERTSRFALLMPQVSPNMPELYLCTPVKVDYTTSYYIVGYEPNATMNTAHHMLIYGCGEPGSTKSVWSKYVFKYSFLIFTMLFLRWQKITPTNGGNSNVTQVFGMRE